MLAQLLWFAYRVSRIASLLLAMVVIVTAIRWFATGAAWSRLTVIPGIWLGLLWFATLLPFACLAAVTGLLDGLWLSSGATVPNVARWLSLTVALGPLLVTIAATAAWFVTRPRA